MPSRTLMPTPTDQPRFMGMHPIPAFLLIGSVIVVMLVLFAG